MGVTSNTANNQPGQGQGTMRDAGKRTDAPPPMPKARTKPDASGETEPSVQGGVEKGRTANAER